MWKVSVFRVILVLISPYSCRMRENVDQSNNRTLFTKFLNYNSDNIGLYRCNWLSVFQNISGKKAEKHKKLIENFLKDKGLHIIIKCNQKVVDYLDTINFNDDTCGPFHQDNI